MLVDVAEPSEEPVPRGTDPDVLVGLAVGAVDRDGQARECLPDESTEALADERGVGDRVEADALVAEAELAFPIDRGYGGSLVPISSHSTSTETGVTELESPVTILSKP